MCVQMSLWWQEAKPAVLKVEDQSGEVFHVKIDGECECGLSDCSHLRYAHRFWSRDKGLLYEAKSGLHKELRRGNESRAIGFAKIIEYFKKGDAKRYMRKILFEETRNLDLLNRFHDGTPVTELIRLFCRSIKDWELAWDVGWFSEPWLEVHAKRCTGPEELPLIYSWPKTEAIPTVVRKMVKQEKFDELYEMIVAAGLGSGYGSGLYYQNKAMREVLVAEAKKRRPDLADSIERCKSLQNDEFSVLFEIISGKFKDEANGYHKSGDLIEIDLPYCENYLYDCHTRIGKTRMKKVGGSIEWEKPQPEGIDLRWSGAEAGTFWRIQAMKQLGATDVSWEKVKLTDELKAQWAEAVGKVY